MRGMNKYIEMMLNHAADKYEAMFLPDQLRACFTTGEPGCPFCEADIREAKFRETHGWIRALSAWSLFIDEVDYTSDCDFCPLKNLIDDLNESSFYNLGNCVVKGSNLLHKWDNFFETGEKGAK